jgi:hypothetical protein
VCLSIKALPLMMPHADESHPAPTSHDQNGADTHGAQGDDHDTPAHDDGHGASDQAEPHASEHH